MGHVHEKAWSWTSVPWKISLDVPRSNRKCRSSNSDPRSLNKKLEVHLHFGKITGHGKDFLIQQRLLSFKWVYKIAPFSPCLGGPIVVRGSLIPYHHNVACGMTIWKLWCKSLWPNWNFTGYKNHSSPKTNIYSTFLNSWWIFHSTCWILRFSHSASLQEGLGKKTRR